MGAKKCNYIIIPEGQEPYQVLAEAVALHDDLSGCNIALAYRKATKADADGRMVLGKCVKVSDLQKEFAQFDFIIVLNMESWRDFSDAQKLALMDHELCHIGEVFDDETGERVCDERGRKLPHRLLDGREWSEMPKVWNAAR